jgi:predicted ATP-grasp superfamily ATP-dependent carboligase
VSQPLLILGASVRAAASSAARAGFTPIGIDLFADRDLTARFRAIRVDRDAYPADLARIARELPAAPWLYTGAIENYPRLVDRIARDRCLLGVAGEALRRARNPSSWTSALARVRLPALDVCTTHDAPPTGGLWLSKPLNSAGGTGIRRWVIGSGVVEGRGKRFLQRFARGRPYSACFLGEDGTSLLIGITRQLLGRSTGIRTVYRGSVGHCPVSAETLAMLDRIGRTLATEIGLQGLFGIDFVLDGETPWPVEINPRYSASVEILEEVTGIPLVGWHAGAFGVSPPVADVRRPEAEAVAKIIVRARRRAVVPEDLSWTDPGAEWPDVADLPAAGTALAPGDPVLTVFGRGGNVREALIRARILAGIWRRRIAGWGSP